jgi:hypothetical protein
VGGYRHKMTPSSSEREKNQPIGPLKSSQRLEG